MRRTRPRRVGEGPSRSSTSHAVERQPFRWDNNRFYARLGLEPDATRVAIARRFLEVGGHSSSALTTAIQLLLDRDRRRFYDALLLGTFWAGDESLQHHRLRPDAGEMVVHSGDAEWSVYADYDVSDEEAMSIHPGWRSRIGLMLWQAGVTVGFSLGVTKGEPRIELVGYEVVVFLTLALTPEWEYAAEVVSVMLSMLLK